MGSVAQAVLEFDESVQVPWRPPLADATGVRPVLVPVPSSRPIRARPHAVRAGRSCAPPTPVRPPSPGPGVRRATVPTGPSGVAPRNGPRAPRPVGVRPPVRLTRRARRLLAVLAVGAGVAVGAWIGSEAAGAGEGLRLVEHSSVVVQPGDTLWGIAGSIAGDGDVRVVVDELQRLNGLEGGRVVPGQALRLP